MDGPGLQAIRFVKGLEDGDMLFARRRRTLSGEDRKLPRFRKTMTANEVMEFVVDSIARAGIVDVEAADLRPAPFGDLPGFRFDLTYRYQSGLDGRGLAVGAVADGRLYMILYTGVDMHYYPKYAPEVEHIVGSVRML